MQTLSLTRTTTTASDDDQLSKIASTISHQEVPKIANMAEDEDEKSAATQSTSSSSLYASTISEISKCAHCRRTVELPVVLPCGHSGCQSCLQKQHLREATFLRPPSPTTCRCLQCGRKHANLEYNVDVTTNKIIGLLKNTMLEHVQSWRDTNEPTEKDAATGTGTQEQPEITENKEEKSAPGFNCLRDMLQATIAAAQESHPLKQEYESGLIVPPKDSTSQNQLCQYVGPSVECAVCYSILMSPSTTPCGHTFCHRCLIRVLDHGHQCPVCRHPMEISKSAIEWPPNVRLESLLTSLFPEQIAARAEAVILEEAPVPPGFDLPLFVCTISYPAMPTFLFVFEPRYRLMIRRIMAGNKKFGMVPSSHAMDIEPSGEAVQKLGDAGICEYGTLLDVEDVEVLDEGTSVVRARGGDRFRLTDFDTRDGYFVGKIETVTDCGEDQEKEWESTKIIETKGRFEALPPEAQESILQRGNAYDPEHDFSALEFLTNEELVEFGHDFVQRMQLRGARGCLQLNRNILKAFGPAPMSQDTFPFWFASVANDSLSRKERYKLLCMTTRRERLLLTGKWINSIDLQASAAPGSCTII